MAERIRLPALIGSHPLAVLAAFGLLRLAADWDKSARLGFMMEDDWVAFIEISHADSIEALVHKLGEWIQSKIVDHAIGWAEDVRVAPGEYRRVLADALASGDLHLAHFLGALAARSFGPLMRFVAGTEFASQALKGRILCAQQH